MTNTLHRYGSRESMTDDYIVFAIAARGINDRGAEAKLRRFLEAALKYDPVNLGVGSQGAMFAPSKDLNLFSTYLASRKHSVAPQEVIGRITKPGVAGAVFDNSEAFEGFLRTVRELDLGLSVNASALVDDTRCACRAAGIAPHSVEYSLGFRGRMDRLPTRRVLELSTMCGHGMVSSNYAKKMIDMVKEGRLAPKQASRYMAKFCTCGVFNVSRSERVLEQARVSD